MQIRSLAMESTYPLGYGASRCELVTSRERKVSSAFLCTETYTVHNKLKEIKHAIKLLLQPGPESFHVCLLARTRHGRTSMATIANGGPASTIDQLSG